MKVHELIAELEKFPLDLDVMVSVFDFEIDKDSYEPKISVCQTHGVPCVIKTLVGEKDGIRKFRYDKKTKEMVKLEIDL